MIKITQPLKDNPDEIVCYIQLTDCIEALWNDVIDESELRSNGVPIFKDKAALHSHLTNAHYKGNIEASHQDSRGQRNIWVVEDCVLDYIDELVNRHGENTGDKAKVSGLLIIPKGLIAPARFPKSDVKKISEMADSLLADEAQRNKPTRKTPRRKGRSLFSRAVKSSRAVVASSCAVVESSCNAVGTATKNAVVATRNAIAKPFRAIAETIESIEDKEE